MKWVGTSWKMNGTLDFARDYANALRGARLAEYREREGIQPFIIPSFTAIDSVRQELGFKSGVVVGAQNAHWEDSGAWTGEVSMVQAKDAGATVIEMGHSERREFFGETDETVNLKAKAALAHGLRPLICFGEPLDVFKAGESLAFITAQVDKALEGIEDTSSILLAYEPIWAIGENGIAPDPEDLAATMKALDERYADRVEAILYGGSVKPQNCEWLMEMPGVNGLFIGRSAWTPQGYLGILDQVAKA